MQVLKINRKKIALYNSIHKETLSVDSKSGNLNYVRELFIKLRVFGWLLASRVK